MRADTNAAPVTGRKEALRWPEVRGVVRSSWSYGRGMGSGQRKVGLLGITGSIGSSVNAASA